MLHARFLVALIATLTTLTWTVPMAHAQVPGAAGDQYTTVENGEGELDAETLRALNARFASCQGCNANGRFEPGETLVFQGSYRTDRSGTIKLVFKIKSTGELISMRHDYEALFRIGSLEIEALRDIPGMTDDLSDLEVVGGTGITVAAEAASSDDGVLPRTGGEFAWLIGGLLTLIAAAFGLRRATRPAPASEQ